MKPMLAGKTDFDKLRFHVIVQPKLDGIRCCIVDGKALSRSLKEIPNRHIYNLLSRPELNGLDGELIVGPATAEDCYRQTVSGVMSSDGEPVFAYHVFDLWNHSGTYRERHKALCSGPLPEQSTIVENALVYDQTELDHIESLLIAAGHEGGIIRGPDTRYKFGRGTNSKGDLLKLKRFVDSEAVVIGVEEELHNANEATTNALGRTERSSHKANKVGKGTLGALVVRLLADHGDIKAGTEFRIGTGFTAAMRASLWTEAIRRLDATGSPGGLDGRIAKFKWFPVGSKDAPRHPVFLGWRSPDDL